MNISYHPLWKLLIDRNLMKSEFQKLVGIGSSTITKLWNNKCVGLDTTIKICNLLDCQIEEVKELKR